jgi:hypothetical protein
MLNFFEQIDDEAAKTFNSVKVEDNFYKSSVARFTQAVLALTTGLSIYHVKPTEQSEEPLDLP